MTARNTPMYWGWVAKSFHWLMFALIVGAWFAFEQHEGFPKGSTERAEWMNLHRAFGASVFFLVWLRLAWRFSSPAPDSVITSRWQHRAAEGVHWALYFLMIMMPLSGLLMSQFGGRAVSWFGVFDIPVFLSENKPLAEQLKSLHEDVWWPLLLTLIGLHVVAAVWHQFIVKDGVLKRMLPFTSRS
jgi:cytochrome b561